MGRILDGKALASKIKDDIRKEVELMQQETGKRPRLDVILVGENEASKVYVRNKERDCEECGIISNTVKLPENISMEELIDTVKMENDNRDVHGILCQLPIPLLHELDESFLINTLNPIKDVDCFHVENVGKLSTGHPLYVPCTPAGIIELLRYNNINIDGKHCVILGRSNIVGKPLAQLMLMNNATVTICHRRTKDLESLCRTADILVAAIGRPKFVTEDMIKTGAVVIDVGINRLENEKLCGDVDFERVVSKTSFITPVPGGVGPMTRVMLLRNVLKAFSIQTGYNKG